MIDLTGVVADAARERPAPLPDLSGSTIGFLDNGKAHADLVLAAAERELVRSHGVTRTVRASKENRWGPASDAVLEELRECDAVVLALAD
jgi:hypothetical protein